MLIDRRRAMILLSCAAVSVDAASARPAGSLIPVRGTRLYVEVLGPANAPAVLYLHGGPGTGSYDFVVMQAARLSGLRLVMLDQRGVLRSDALKADEPFGLNDLIEDAEALRAALGIERWSVLGHSFGGYLGLLYANAYRRSVTKIAFENPTFDFRSTATYTLEGAAEEFRQAGDAKSAEEALDAAHKPDADDRAMWRRFTALTNRLGPRRMNLYMHGPNKNFFDEIVAQSGLPKEAWDKGGQHQLRLYEERLVFRPLFDALNQLEQPALLIKGAYDRVTPPNQVAAFGTTGKRTLALFADSSHFARYEEPELYARTVLKFLL
jgi:proline iminopeptidase